MRGVQYQDRELSTVFIRGATPAIADINSLNLSVGRFYSEVEERTGRPVCIIGQDVAEALFPNETPVGKLLRRLLVAGEYDPEPVENANA